MKFINRQISFTLVLFPVVYLWRKSKAARVVFIFFTIFLAGCFQEYYRTNTQTHIDTATIQKLMALDKVFIIHSGNQYLMLNNPATGDNQITGDVVNVPDDHAKYMEPRTDKANRVKNIDKPVTLMEVHLYTTEKFEVGKHISLPLNSINRIDVYEFDKQTTSANHVLSLLGIVVVGGALAALIVTAIACNCPQVCVNDGQDYQFVSGVYSGAIYASLERTDYLPLGSLTAVDNQFRIKVKNVKDEEQFINRMQLLQVDHPKDVRVLADRHGNILSYQHLQTPLKATTGGNENIREDLAATDNKLYRFDNQANENHLSSVELSFQKPAGSNKAKLVVHGGNSFWSGYLYHSFAELFGTGYEKWKQQKDISNPKEMEKWQTDQSLPLMVYLEKNGKWEFVDYFAHTGNTASRDMIMELDLGSTNSKEVKIKLETVYQFWNLDQAAIDFSANENFTTAWIDPVKAVKADGSDRPALLKQTDKNYLHLDSEQELELSYPTPSIGPGQEVSYFFVSTGYYHNLKKYTGQPQLSKLTKFKNKNTFDQFSREKFNDLKTDLSQSTAKDKR